MKMRPEDLAALLDPHPPCGPIRLSTSAKLGVQLSIAAKEHFRQISRRLGSRYGVRPDDMILGER